jgi:nitrogen fixation-related uncharacterized protein
MMIVVAGIFFSLASICFLWEYGTDQQPNKTAAYEGTLLHGQKRKAKPY